VVTLFEVYRYPLNVRDLIVPATQEVALALSMAEKRLQYRQDESVVVRLDGQLKETELFASIRFSRTIPLEIGTMRRLFALNNVVKMD
jgi:hypothetical protein